MIFEMPALDVKLMHLPGRTQLEGKEHANEFVVDCTCPNNTTHQPIIVVSSKSSGVSQGTPPWPDQAPDSIFYGYGFVEASMHGV